MSSLNPIQLEQAIRKFDIKPIREFAKKSSEFPSDRKLQCQLLHTSCEVGFKDGVVELLGLGCSVDSVENGVTPLEVCAIFDQENVIDVLVEAGCNTGRHVNGYSALHHAAVHNSGKATAKLIKLGFDLDQQDENGRGFAPLHWAAQEDSIDVTKRLLESGANPNTSTKDGLCPIHIAAAEGHTEILKELLDFGADVDRPFTADAESTALQIACVWERLKCAQMLVKAGANRFSSNLRSENACQIANRLGNSQLAALLSV
jgi:ankyrin repeat protein